MRNRTNKVVTYISRFTCYKMYVTTLLVLSILIKSKCVSVSQSVSVGLEPRVELKPGRERGERERDLITN